MLTGIIMASGFSRRMNKNKLLLDIDGEPMIEKIIKTVKKSNLEDIILIYRDEELKKIGDKYNILTVFNSRAQYGQSESMKLGIINSSNNTNGYIFFVGDQPYLSLNTINILVDTFKKNNNSIIVPRYNGKKGNPVVFSRIFKEKLLMINGDEGGRHLIKKNNNRVIFVDLDIEIEGNDIDTIDEYNKFKHFNSETNLFHK